MNRGSASGLDDDIGLLGASMRPRFMNRGSAVVDAVEDDIRLRFNEAPIHESGKCGQLQRSHVPARGASMRPRFMNRGSAGAWSGPATRRSRFNEAPIHESGK